MGLCALNYSSHLALNVYGISCALFILLLLLGIPESWYKSDQFIDGTTSLDIIYFSLLALLIVLLVFSFTFAHYLRHQETTINKQQDKIDQIDYNSSECICIFNQQQVDPLDEYNPSMAKERYVTVPLLAPVKATICRKSNDNTNEFHDQMNLARRRYNAQTYLRNNTTTTTNNNCQSMQMNDSYPINNLQNTSRTTNNLYPANSTTIDVDGRYFNQCRVTTQPLSTQKGFYQRVPHDMIVRAKSFNRLPNDEPNEFQFENQWITDNENLSRNNQRIALNSMRDDTLVQYGRKQRSVSNNHNSATFNGYNSSTIGHCRCRMKDGALKGAPRKLNNDNLIENNNNFATTTYLKSSPSSTPYSDLHLTSSYALRQPVIRSRNKGTNSVMAVTAAAAAALFGGVADMNCLSTEPQVGDGGGLFGGVDLNEPVPLDQDGFGANDQQLDVSILNQAPQLDSTYHHVTS